MQADRPTLGLQGRYESWDHVQGPGMQPGGSHLNTLSLNPLDWEQPIHRDVSCSCSHSPRTVVALPEKERAQTAASQGRQTRQQSQDARPVRGRAVPQRAASPWQELPSAGWGGGATSPPPLPSLHRTMCSGAQAWLRADTETLDE